MGLIVQQLVDIDRIVEDFRTQYFSHISANPRSFVTI